MKPHVFLIGTALLMLSRLGLGWNLWPLWLSAVATLLGLLAYAEVACDLARDLRSDGVPR